MKTKLMQIAIENSDEIVQMWLEKLDSLKRDEFKTTTSDELFESTNREFVNVIFTSIKQRGSLIEIVTFSEKLITLGWPLSYITDGLQILDG
ncbi:hypothetical protein CV093_03265 [Oceanobacillus sp. 143]|nr:hypothetical protein CV093_03265 [Oceanobacillus sp. 143]